MTRWRDWSATNIFGNIRELQNVAERAVVLTAGRCCMSTMACCRRCVTRATQQHQTCGGLEDADGHEALLSLDDAERLHIERVLTRTRGVIEGTTGAANVLKLHPNTLRSRMKKPESSAASTISRSSRSHSPRNTVGHEMSWLFGVNARADFDRETTRIQQVMDGTEAILIGGTRVAISRLRHMLRLERAEDAHTGVTCTSMVGLRRVGY